MLVKKVPTSHENPSIFSPKGGVDSPIHLNAIMKSKTETKA